MTYYLSYKLKNEAPLRFADDSIAQKGQTGTLHYIPGSAMRGLVITELANKGFDEKKEPLFTSVRFLNAYPVVEDTPLLPSPKGFYEDKAESDGKKPLKNVVTDGKSVEGLKRARLGEFCSLSGDTIFFYSMQTGGDLKIRMDGDQMFRNEYIDSGYMFSGAIASEDRDLLETISSIIGEKIYLGNARGAGMGTCTVLSKDISENIPFEEDAIKADKENECYMMLLSPTAMRDKNGEPTGLDLGILQDRLGVQNLKVSYCSTSVRNIQGYNRTWRGHIPSVMMYDKGSVFHLTFDGKLEQSKARALMDSGIGERIYDGFGRVLFMEGYDTLQNKERGGDLHLKNKSGIEPEASDEEVLYSIARKYYRRLMEDAMDRYIVDHPLDKGMLGSSKTRGVEPILTMNRFDYDNAVRLLGKYFEHEKEKESKQRVHKDLKSTRNIGEHVFTVLEGDLEDILSMETKNKEEVMTIPKKKLMSAEEIGEMKLLFLVKELRYDSRQEVRS